MFRKGGRWRGPLGVGRRVRSRAEGDPASGATTAGPAFGSDVVQPDAAIPIPMMATPRDNIANVASARRGIRVSYHWGRGECRQGDGRRKTAGERRAVSGEQFR